MNERTKLGIFIAVFAACWFLPVDSIRFMDALEQGLNLVKWYAQKHVLLCLVPAFFIAGAISIFASQGAVMKYLGPGASKLIAYPVAAVSGVILAVCSCTVLPLFAGIHKRGAGLGPATAFLYSGPAISVLSIILTARVLGVELGIARAVSAIVFSVVIGLCMHFIFRKSEAERTAGAAVIPDEQDTRNLAQNAAFFFSMVGILVFANWATVHWFKWAVTGVFGVALVFFIWRWFEKDELLDWTDSSWTFAKQIMPLLLAGVLVAGFLLGTPKEIGGADGLIPSAWIAGAVGGNSLSANLFASIAGAFMYFATLTEVPILDGLMNAGMGKGPALSLLLAGPALSLPNMLVIRSVMGTLKTAVYIGLVVVLSTIAGITYGTFF